MKNNKYRYSNLDLNSSGWRSLTTWILENNGGTSNEIWKIYIKWMINQLFLSKWVKINNNFDVKIIRQPFRSDCEPMCWSVTFVYALSHIYFQINVHLILMKNSCFFSKANRICKHDKMTLIYETNTHDRKINKAQSKNRTTAKMSAIILSHWAINDMNWNFLQICVYKNVCLLVCLDVWFWKYNAGMVM